MLIAEAACLAVRGGGHFLREGDTIAVWLEYHGDSCGQRQGGATHSGIQMLRVPMLSPQFRFRKLGTPMSWRRLPFRMPRIPMLWEHCTEPWALPPTDQGRLPASRHPRSGRHQALRSLRSAGGHHREGRGALWPPASGLGFLGGRSSLIIGSTAPGPNLCTMFGGQG